MYFLTDFVAWTCCPGYENVTLFLYEMLWLVLPLPFPLSVDGKEDNLGGGMQAPFPW